MRLRDLAEEETRRGESKIDFQLRFPTRDDTGELIRRPPSPPPTARASRQLVDDGGASTTRPDPSPAPTFTGRRAGVGRAAAARPPVAAHPRPVGGAGQRGDAAADPGGARDPALGVVPRPVPDAGRVRRGVARRRAARVAGARLSAAGAQPARRPRSGSTSSAASRATSTGCWRCPASGPTRRGRCWRSPSSSTPPWSTPTSPGSTPVVAGASLTARAGAGARRRGLPDRRRLGVEPVPDGPRRRAVPPGRAGLRRVPGAGAGAAGAIAGGDDPALGSSGVSVRQARFEGSDRQARGRLMKALVGRSRARRRRGAA